GRLFLLSDTDLDRRERAPLLDVPDDRLLDTVPVLVEDRRERRRHPVGAKHLKHPVNIGKIGGRFVDGRVEVIGYHRDRLRQHLGDTRVDWQTAEIWAPGDLYTAEFTIERLPKAFSGLIDHERV